ncbi:MAG: polyprenyl synthetase family protein [Clostridia bacterium]|nr:polyprenyl synthetase family protein [Clostridia bacterium]
MDLGLFEPIIKELNMVEDKLAKDFRLRSGSAVRFAHLEYPVLERYLRPALVILFARLNNFTGEKVISLSGIIQLIYLASNIHLAVPDEDRQGDLETMDPRDGSQLPVLVGDYLYGKFYTSLCDAKIVYMLKPLADIICLMNEGSIKRRKGEKSGGNSLETMLEIIQKETAELFAGACRLGAELGQAPENEIRKASNFGMFFGMAYGFLNHGLNKELVREYGEKALQELANFKDSPNKKLLLNLVSTVLNDNARVQWAVV